MSHYTEAVMKEICGLTTKTASIKLVLEAVPDFSIKKGGESFIVWCEGEPAQDPKTAMLTKHNAPLSCEFEQADVSLQCLLLKLKGKRVRLHAKVAPADPVSITSIDAV